MQALAGNERIKFRRVISLIRKTAVCRSRRLRYCRAQTSCSQKRVTACRRSTSRKLVFQCEICKSMSRCIAAGSPPHLKLSRSTGATGGADRLVYAPFRRRAYLCSPCTRLKRALGLKFNPSGLGILNLSGFGLWRSDLLARRAGPYPR